MGPSHQTMMLRGCLVAAVTALVCPAFAGAEENGVKMGAGRLHPSFELETRFDSFAVASDTRNAGDLILHLRPGFDFGVEGAKVAFDFDAQADVNLHTGLVFINTLGMSESEAKAARAGARQVARELTYIGGKANLNLSVNPTGQVGFDFGDRFSHSDLNSAISLGQGVRSFYNEVYASLPIRPGGGAIQVRPRYALGFEAFQAFDIRGVPAFEGLEQPGNLDHVAHRPGLEGRWRFLPKTALILDVGAETFVYLNGQGTGGNLPVWAFQSRAGISGLITPKLSLTAAAGYGDTFKPNKEIEITRYGQTTVPIIGNLELSFVPNPTVRVKAGYTRSFKPVPLRVWYGDDNLYAEGSILLVGRYLVSAGTQFHYLRYHPVNGAIRTDTLFMLNLGFGARITEWLETRAAWRFTSRGSSDVDPYTRHEVSLLGIVRY